MKIGNVPLPASEPLKQQTPAPQDKAAGEGSTKGQVGEAFKVELSESAGAMMEGAVTSAEEALKLAEGTREMIAENNRESANVHTNLDPKKLLDLLA